jgi:hypothetical protein
MVGISKDGKSMMMGSGMGERGMMPGMAGGMEGMMGGMPGMMPGIPTPGRGMMGAGGMTAGRTEKSPRILLSEKAALLAKIDVPAADRKILEGLERSVPIEFPNQTPLEDVLKHIRTVSQSWPNNSGLPIYVDPVGLQEAEQTLTSPITMELRGVPLKTTLTLLLKQLQLAYQVRGGLLFISSPRRLAQEKNPSPSQAIHEALEQPVAMPFSNETPLEDVLSHIKETAKLSTGGVIPIHVDPRGLQEVGKSRSEPVQFFDLEGVPLKTTLRLLLKQLELAYCVRDGVLIISSVERINEEIEEALSVQEAAKPATGDGFVIGKHF